MCYIDEADLPTAFEQTTVRVRKPRPCCECKTEIEAGDSATVYKGLWQGTGWASYTMCIPCKEMRSAMQHIADPDWLPPFTELVQCAVEEWREAAPHIEDGPWMPTARKVAEARRRLRKSIEAKERR